MFKVCFTYEYNQPNPFTLQVAIPDGKGKFLIYKFVFREARKMIEMGQMYYCTYVYDSTQILDFHLLTIKEYEYQPELPFANWHNTKGKFEVPES